MSSPIAAQRTTKAMAATPIRSTVALFVVTVWPTDSQLDEALVTAPAAEPAAAPAAGTARPAASPALEATRLAHRGRPDM